MTSLNDLFQENKIFKNDFASKSSYSLLFFYTFKVTNSSVVYWKTFGMLIYYVNYRMTKIKVNCYVLYKEIHLLPLNIIFIFYMMCTKHLDFMAYHISSVGTSMREAKKKL